MKIKSLGTQGLTASELGLGCMGMSEFYGQTNDEESIKTLHRAHELGINFLDTADAYGPHKNEILVGEKVFNQRTHLQEEVVTHVCFTSKSSFNYFLSYYQ